MRALTLNLLVEEQLAQAAEARDPFKVTVAGGIGLITLAVLFGTLLSQLAQHRKVDGDVLQAHMSELEQVQQANAGNETRTIKAQVDDYISLNKTRPLFAPQMALIKNVVPDTIQLNSLRFSLNTDAAPPPPPSDGEGKKRPAKPKATEHLQLQLDGRVTCARPELEVDQFIQTMQTNDAFHELLGDVKLKSIARSGVPGSSVPTAVFLIECSYKDKDSK